MNVLKHASQRKDFGLASHHCWKWANSTSYYRAEKSAYGWSSMGGFAKGAVEHGRNRIFNFLFHFEHFWRVLSHSWSRLLHFVLGFERFSQSVRHERSKTCDAKEGFWSPLSSMLILTAISLFHFRSPAPFQHQCWTSCAKNASSPSSKSTLMKEGAAKSSKFSHFLPVFPPFV